MPVHIIQRGNNCQVCFVSDEDHGAYAGWLKEYSKKYKVDIHAWVMMTNHVHLLCTPDRWMLLAVVPLERYKNYRALFGHHVDDTNF